MSRIEETIEVNAPVSDCYAIWTDFEHFPMFMKNVKEVRYKGDDHAMHWVVKGPMGKDVEWDAEVDSMQPNKAVSWHSKAPSEVQNSGAVTFEQSGSNKTTVHVVMEYETPGGVLGDLVAGVFQNPDRMVREDLENFKDLIENERQMLGGAMPAQSANFQNNQNNQFNQNRDRYNQGTDDFHTSGASNPVVNPVATTGEMISPNVQPNMPNQDTRRTMRDDETIERPANPGPII